MMFTSTRSFRFVAALLAAFLMVTGLQASASAATKRSIGVSASPAVAALGTAVTLSGKVSRSPKGTAVVIERKVGRKWVRVTATKTVNPSGTYAATFKRPATLGTYAYRAVAPRKGNLKAATSRAVSVAALKRTLASLSSSTPLTVAGTTVKLSGTVLPATRGTAVTLQRRAGSTWVSAGSTTVQANGTFSRDVTPTTTTTYRALIARSGSNAPATTNQRVVQARPRIGTTALPAATRFGAYTFTLAADFGAVGTWSVTNLPAGLSLTNASRGIISGTPSTQGDTNVVVRFTQTSTGLTSPSKTLTLRVGPAVAPVITTNSLVAGAVGAPYSQQLSAGGATGTWTAAPLPDGLTLDGDTITGTPTTAGDTNVVINFTQANTGQIAAAKTLTLRIGAEANPVIETGALPEATRLTPYSFGLEAVGDPAGSWTAEPLPDGLTLDAETGVISGTPTTVGTTQVVVGFTQASNSLTAAPKTLELTVNEAAAPVIDTANLPEATRFNAYSFQLTAVGDPEGTWSATNLPTGLSLNEETGVISGIPTVVETRQVEIGFVETRTGVPAASKTLELKVNQAAPPVIATATLSDAVRFQAYTATLTVTGNPVGTWSATGVPTGMTLSPAGVLSGTPRNAGDFSITVGFTQTNSGLSTSKVLVLRVLQAPPVITTPAQLPDGSPLTPYSIQLQVAPAQVGRWTLRSGSLPIGITLKDDGEISGGTLFPGNYRFTIRFTETSTGLFVDRQFFLKIS